VARINDTRRDRSDNSRYNFAVLLGQGTLVDLSSQLGSAHLVLPFLYSALGAPLAFAGLLVPASRIGRLFAQASAAPFIATARIRTWYMAFGSLAMGVSLAALALFAAIIDVHALPAVFLLVASVIGIGQGVGSLAFQDVLGRTLPPHRRGSLLFTQTALGAAFAIAAAWGTARIFEDAESLSSHMTLIWISAAALVLASACSALVRGVAAKREVKAEASGFISDLRRNVALTGRFPWFRRFLVARFLFLSVELAMMFYSIHAASLHSEKAGSLSAFVIASSLGFVVGGPLWGWLINKSLRLVFVLGGIAGAGAASLALCIAYLNLQSVPPYALVFVLAALGYQAVSQCRKVYLVDMAPEDQRPYFLSVSDTLIGSLAIGVGALFGLLAHIQGVTWPVVGILAMTVLAVLYVFALPSTETDTCGRS
jgi:hypothetical protein